MTDESIPRRTFLVGAGIAGTVAATGIDPAPAAAAAPPESAPVPTPTAQPEAWLTLNPTEAAFVTAAVDTLIPADDLTPSASACGVAVFIDRQLAG
ncbi:MAG: gluconate 2-dehydrogenase subunit 3 family protein, partial [Xanthobacteraceae bacterium]|nr:gluconate 2-dehydrogenase subunit 3 family protein [Xanthobacteraceae bacterium]